MLKQVGFTLTVLQLGRPGNGSSRLCKAWLRVSLLPAWVLGFSPAGQLDTHAATQPVCSWHNVKMHI